MDVFLLLRQARNTSAKIFRFIAKVVPAPAQREERTSNQGFTLHRLQKSIQNYFTPWPYQEESLFETPYLPRKNIKNLFILAEGHPSSSPLDGEDGEEDIVRSGKSQVLTHQLKRPHKGVRIGMDLGRR